MTRPLISDTAILATSSDTLAMGLDALLLTIPPIAQVRKVADSVTLLELLETLDPVLILLDTSIITSEPLAFLQNIRALSPKSLRVLISNNVSEFRDLVYDCSDIVVLNGTDPGRLAKTIEFLLNDGIPA